MRTPNTLKILPWLGLLLLLCLTTLQPSKSYAGICFLGFIDCETEGQRVEREAREEQVRLEKEAELAFLKAERINQEIPDYTYRKADLAHDIAQGWELILVVNRSTDPIIGQTLAIYLHGKLLDLWQVSTALEEDLFNPHRRRTSFATTNMGRFRPGKMHREYTSNSWDEELPFMIFFGNPQWGIGFHQANSKKAQSKIGTRASAGCVRLRKGEAEELFELVREYKTLIIVQESAASDTDHVPSVRELFAL